MIPSYSAPDFRINQLIRPTRPRSNARNVAVIVGEQRDLLLDDGRQLVGQDFLDEGLVLEFLDTQGNDVGAAAFRQINQDSVTVRGNGLLSNLAVGLPNVSISSPARPDILTGGSSFAGSGRYNSLARNLAPGDFVRVIPTVGGVAQPESIRKIVNVLPTLLGSEVSAVSRSSVALLQLAADTVTQTNSDFSFVSTTVGSAARFLQTGIVKSPTNEDAVGDFFTVTCVNAGAAVGDLLFRVVSRYGNTSQDISLSGIVGAAGDLALSSVTNYDLTIRVTVSSPATALGKTLEVFVRPSVDLANNSPLSSGTFTGETNRIYTIEVIKGGLTSTDAKFRVYESTGTEPMQTIDGSLGLGSYPLGIYGALISLDPDPYYATGERFTVEATASSPSSTASNRLVVDGPVVPVNTAVAVTLVVDALEEFNGFLTVANTGGSPVWSLTDNKLVISDFLSSTVGTPFLSGYGKVFVGFTATVLPVPGEAPVFIADLSQASELLGELHPANELAFGVLVAMADEGQTNQVYALRTAGSDSTALAEALQKLETGDSFYTLGILSEDIYAVSAVEAHVVGQSGSKAKRWRKAYFSSSSPSTWEVWGLLPTGGYRRMDLAGGTVTVQPADRLSSNFTESARVGDIIKSGPTGELVITQIYPNGYQVDVKVLSTNLTPSDQSDVPFQLIKPETADNIADFVISRSVQISSRRMTNVWADHAYRQINGQTILVAPKFFAAEAAGRRASLAPQRGMTHLSFSAASSIPGAYTRFTPSVLDRMASYGVFIITQDAQNARVYCRHQLTTQTGQGPESWQDNIAHIHDAYCYAVKDGIAGQYIGVRNAVESTRRDLEILITDISNTSTSEPAGSQIGPMIVEFFNENNESGKVTVRRDADLTNKFVFYSNLQVPLPLDEIEGFVTISATSFL